MRISKQQITRIIAEDLGKRNVRPFYNGWLLYRNGKWEFCSMQEVEDQMRSTMIS